MHQFSNPLTHGAVSLLEHPRIQHLAPGYTPPFNYSTPAGPSRW